MHTHKVCIRPVMTYGASLAHANPKAPTNSRFCKTTSAEEPPAHPTANHPNPLLQTAVSYEPSLHIIFHPKVMNVLSDPPTNSPRGRKANKHKQRHDRTLGTDTSQHYDRNGHPTGAPPALLLAHSARG
ncbi:hypothetical protein EVAR_77030_1 [Eumeta japonica]|uniref:Uncharacterized protein n=1 Tax=Eumeta variegata TaxID=151549 RepID=A0A4C1T164_EUMVA|nr:hypothetical protein EVAR_77030_1 [Eumeta japonica]